VKALRSSAAVIIRTTADDAAWVVECRAATEWLKQREAAAQAATGALEAVGSVPAAQGSEPSEVAAPSAAGPELRSTSTAQASIEAAEAEEGSGGSADQGPKERPASGRSDDRAATGAVGSFWWTGV
jgi:hypothetical protein